MFRLTADPRSVAQASDMTPISVMHLTDTLFPGGAERVAVNLVNLMPRDRYCPHLCTTRRDGLLKEIVADHVARICLRRKNRFDMRAMWRLLCYIRKHDIQILHAHGTSLFIAAIASVFPPRPALVWHDHYGNYAVRERPAWLYRPVANRVKGVIAVNQPLAEWSGRRLGVPSDRIWYIPNFVCKSECEERQPALPGKPGSRIVCVANLRPQKDHVSLLRAMAIVTRHVPAAHLLLVGAANDPSYLDLVQKEISQQRLDANVSLLGQQSNVSTILRSCDIGVLSSASEGLPLVLIEYGMSGLPCVATRVGQCAEVLDEGKAGMLVPPGAPEQLAEALLSLLQSPQRRRDFGEQFRRRAEATYSPDAVAGRVWRVYDTVLGMKEATLS